MAIKTPDKPSRAPEPLEGKWPEQGEWTYADYKRLPDDGWRYEVIEGDLLMAPAPTSRHQRTVLNLAKVMDDYARAHSAGEVYISPIDVILPNLASPVQPDILFVSASRSRIISDQLVDGPPDLIVEILSPGNWISDRRTKYRIYAQAGVREYWIVDPKARSIEVFALRGEAYEQMGRYEAGDVARSEVLAGFEASVGDICPT